MFVASLYLGIHSYNKDQNDLHNATFKVQLPQDYFN